MKQHTCYGLMIAFLCSILEHSVLCCSSTLSHEYQVTAWFYALLGSRVQGDNSKFRWSLSHTRTVLVKINVGLSVLVTRLGGLAPARSIIAVKVSPVVLSISCMRRKRIGRLRHWDTGACMCPPTFCRHLPLRYSAKVVVASESALLPSQKTNQTIYVATCRFVSKLPSNECYRNLDPNVNDMSGKLNFSTWTCSR